jgi:NADPH-dependent 2,4-dienoyl-CoA reductase/sulfur reductase-like enzyme
LSPSAIDITFATGLPSMFGVPKYATALNQLRVERGVDALFEHDLTAIDGNTATFTGPGNTQVTQHFDFLHVSPKNKPHTFVAESSIANAAGYVDVSTRNSQTSGPSAMRPVFRRRRLSPR